MKKLITILLLFFGVVTYSQDTLWKTIVIDENMTTSMPVNTSKTDTVLYRGSDKLRFLIYKAETLNTSFGVTVTPNEINLNVDNTESLHKAYKEIESGFRENAALKDFSCKFSDTSIDNIPGKKAIATSNNPENAVAFTSFLFLLNDKLYTIVLSPLNDSNSEFKKDIDKLLKGSHFTANFIKEKQFNSKAESIGYKLGKIAAVLLLVGIAVFFIARRK